VLDFKNCLLVEQPNGDFAQTIARHLLYTTWQHLLLQRLTQSSDRFLSEFAHKAVKEIAYHRELAAEWTIRLGDGTEESTQRMGDGLAWMWRFVPELFEVDEIMQAAIDAGIAPDPREFEDEYRAAIAAVLGDARLDVPADQRAILGGRRGHHSEHLGHLLAPMQYLARTYPDAVW
jgi:ring-1,2-phenylacetyl-CoA epoxidase subunit PaaC